MIPDRFTPKPVHVAAQLRARGVDLSSHQSLAVTRQALTQGVDFGIVKATQGSAKSAGGAYVNPLLAAQVSELAGHARTVAIGLYHFLDSTDGALQWDHFEQTITHAKLPARPYLIAVDHEPLKGVLPPDHVAQAFLKRGTQRGYKVGRYGSSGVTMSRNLGEAWRWVAQYSQTPPRVRWDVWQFADRPLCDWNVFRGDRTILAAFVQKFGHRSVLSPPLRWWLHDQTAGKALGPYRTAGLAAARLVTYVVSHPRSRLYSLRRA